MIIECHRTLPDAAAASWDAFMRTARHAHPRQMPAFAEIEAALGHDVLHVLGRQDGRVCAVGQFSLRRSRILPGRYAAAVALSGPVSDDADTMVAFLSALARSSAFARVDSIVVTPYWLDTEAGALARVLDAAGWIPTDPEPMRHTGLIDLARPPEAIRASFAANARRKVRMVEEAGVEIRPVATPAEAAVFFDRLNRLGLQRHGLTLVSQAEHEAAWRAVYAPGEIGVILGAWQAGTFLGGLLLYRSAHYAHARRYVADPAAGRLRIAPALWYQGMLWARAQGCRVLDVEGFRLVDNKDDPLFNVYEYKRELRPEPALRIGERTLVLNALAWQAVQVPRRLRSLLRRRFPALAAALRRRS
jgi:lipid II:glycine glycyltransferase (peptidoglycan interpeptide bridge formation enzyme)